MATHSQSPQSTSSRLTRGRAARVVSSKSLGSTNFVDLYSLGPAERIALVKRGCPPVSVQIAKTIGRPKERLMKVLGLPRATPSTPQSSSPQQLSIEHGEV